jgi:hypothetical protein
MTTQVEKKSSIVENNINILRRRLLSKEVPRILVKCRPFQ